MTRLDEWSCEVCGSDEDPCECPPPESACSRCGAEAMSFSAYCSACEEDRWFRVSAPEMVEANRRMRRHERAIVRQQRGQKPHGGIPDAERWLR